MTTERTLFNPWPEYENIKGRLYKLWNNLDLPDYIFGHYLYDSWQVTEPTGEMTEDQKASLSNGRGYPKFQPDAWWHREVSGLLPPGFVKTDVGVVEQESLLPRDYIRETDDDINTGLKAMLVLFKDSLIPTGGDPRRYYWYVDDEDAPPNNLKVGEKWGDVLAFPYRWEHPGTVEDPTGIISVDTETSYQQFRLVTMYNWWGCSLENDFIVADDMQYTEHITPESLYRLGISRFWLTVIPTAQRLKFELEGDEVNPIGKILLYDYDWELKPKMVRDEEYHKRYINEIEGEKTEGLIRPDSGQWRRIKSRLDVNFIRELNRG